MSGSEKKRESKKKEEKEQEQQQHPEGEEPDLDPDAQEYLEDAAEVNLAIKKGLQEKAHKPITALMLLHKFHWERKFANCAGKPLPSHETYEVERAICKCVNRLVYKQRHVLLAGGRVTVCVEKEQMLGLPQLRLHLAKGGFEHDVAFRENNKAAVVQVWIGGVEFAPKRPPDFESHI